MFLMSLWRNGSAPDFYHLFFDYLEAVGSSPTRDAKLYYIFHFLNTKLTPCAIVNDLVMLCTVTPIRCMYRNLKF